MTRPDMAGRTSPCWGWSSDCVIAHDGRLWWVNLQRGLLSCDPFQDTPQLRLDDLPETISDDIQVRSPRDLEEDRFVSVSRGKMRFVELTRMRTEPLEATMVVMWTLIIDPRDGFSLWKRRYETMFGQIWKNQSYKGTKMGKELPKLALISPTNPDVVFFLLQDKILSVNVPEGRLLNYFEHTCGPDMLGHQPTPQPPMSWRYIVAWELPLSLSTRGQHCRVPSVLRNKTLQLKRAEYALKLLRDDSLTRLEEGLLLRNDKKDDSSWNKIQILLLGVLAMGISALFSFLPWLPLKLATPIVLSVGVVWSLGCIALPFVLFASHEWELGVGHHIARAVFMCFSVFILFGLYRMCKYPTPESLAPAPSDEEEMILGWIEYTFSVLLVVVLGGQTLSWIMRCCKGIKDL